MSRQSGKKSKKGLFDFTNPARSSAFRIVRSAHSVKINERAIEKFADFLVAGRVKIPVWSGERHYLTKDPRRQLEYLILLDALNFCFWARRGEKWHFNYYGERVSGYFALSIAIKKFFEDHPEKGLHDFLTMPYAKFAAIFQGGENLQLLKKRHEIARAVAEVIIRHYGGDVLKFVATARPRTKQSCGARTNGDAGALVRKIARELPSFDDCANHGGRRVYLLKRAQILVSDIVGAFGGRGPGKLKNLEYLTAFPDYKLPQLFHHYDIFEYVSALEHKITRGTPIGAGSTEEIEIRAATIATVDTLSAALNARGVKILPYETDWLLWEMSQKIKLRSPHHKTVTWFY